MMGLQALIFGFDTQSDTHEARRVAYNCVFAEAGLNWQWSSAQFESLLKSSTGNGLLRWFIEAERPHWGWSDDIAKMIDAAERRQASICRDLLLSGVCRDAGVAAVIAEAAAQGIAVAGLTSVADAARVWMPPPIAIAPDYSDALDTFGVPTENALAVEICADAADTAQSRGLVAIHKSQCDWTMPPQAVLQRLIDFHSDHTGHRRSDVVASYRTSEQEFAECSSRIF